MIFLANIKHLIKVQAVYPKVKLPVSLLLYFNELPLFLPKILG